MKKNLKVKTEIYILHLNKIKACSLRRLFRYVLISRAMEKAEKKTYS